MLLGLFRLYKSCRKTPPQASHSGAGFLTSRDGAGLVEAVCAKALTGSANVPNTISIVPIFMGKLLIPCSSERGAVTRAL
jgi:hypothetical protein